jgi:hypothetical protein
MPDSNMKSGRTSFVYARNIGCGWQTFARGDGVSSAGARVTAAGSSDRSAQREVRDRLGAKRRLHLRQPALQLWQDVLEHSPPVHRDAREAARCGGSVRRRSANRCASVLCGAGRRRGIDRRRAYRGASPRQCELHAGDNPAGVLGRVEAAQSHRAERANPCDGLMPAAAGIPAPLALAAVDAAESAGRTNSMQEGFSAIRR